MLYISDMLLHFETKTLQRRLGSKVDAKFRTFWPLEKLGEGWAKCPSEFFLCETYNATSDIDGGRVGGV